MHIAGLQNRTLIFLTAYTYAVVYGTVCVTAVIAEYDSIDRDSALVALSYATCIWVRLLFSAS